MMSKLFKNILWMLIDKAFLLVGGFIVTVMVARYLGPNSLGLISYGLALGAIVISISQWGANYTIFDTASRNVRRSVRFIQSSELLRGYIYILSYFTISFWVLFFSEYNTTEAIIILLVFASQIFLSLDIYQFHFNATLNSKINAKSSIYAKALSMGLRAAFVFLGVDVIWFILPFFVEGILMYLMRRHYFNLTNVSIHKKKSIKYKRKYFSVGIPLVATGICTTLYSKVYDVMLANMTSYVDVGLYGVGNVINTAWTFIPMAVGISCLSTPMKEIEENKKLTGYSFVTLVIIMVSLPIMLFIYFFHNEIINITFGIKYERVKEILFMLSIGSFLSTLGFFFNRMINSFPDGSGYLLKKVFISAVVMVLLSYFLVRQYSLNGAVYGYVISEFLNLTLLNYLFRNGIIFKIQIGILSSLKYCVNYR